MTATHDCVFCEILAGRSPASFLHRDELCSAFMDLVPVNPGHLLVIPNAHAATLAEVEADTAAHMLRVGQRLAAGLRASGLRCEGVNLFLADGVEAGQEVFHAHLHVIPRFRGDRWTLSFGHDGRPQPRALLDEAAERIRKAME